MADRYYVDSSAYLCTLLGEAGAEAIARELAGARLLSSVLMVLEAHRTLVRVSREGVLSPVDLQRARERLEEDVARFALRDLTPDLCGFTPMPAVTTPRSLDLAHLRTALWFHAREPLARFVSLDEPQNQAARELGLPV